MTHDEFSNLGYLDKVGVARFLSRAHRGLRPESSAISIIRF